MICVSVIGKNIEELIREAKKAKLADIIELRIDYIKNLDIEKLIKMLKQIKKPIIITNRKRPYGKFEGREKERISILKRLIKFVDYVDIEVDSVKKFGFKNKLIVSYHNFKGTYNLLTIYNKLKNYEIIKIATYANSINDNIKIFNLIKKAKAEGKKIIALCMGEKGEISRILNLRYGSYLTYASLSKGKEVAPGQLTIKDMIELYRVKEVNDKTKIYGLIGNPVSKSKGYIIHNKLFKKFKLNCIYLNFLVDNLKSFITNFKPIFSGLSITMPFKQSILKYIDGVDEKAKRIGAINTIVKKEGKLIGYNTDYYGALIPIKKLKIKDEKAVVVGAGGVAKAIIEALTDEGVRVVIMNRTETKAKMLAKEFNCAYKKITELGKELKDASLLVNATPVGMAPNINETIVEKRFLHQNLVVFDVVYNPVKTRLLREAEQKGCKLVTGLEMFVYQAAKQFQLWCGKYPKPKLIKSIIKDVN